MYYLPKSLEVDGREYPIRTDYRVALTIFEACNSYDLSPQEKAIAVVKCLYKEIPENFSAAHERAVWFLDGGDMPKSKQDPRRMMDWEQDEYIIFPALNKVAGYEIREAKYLHWWSFLGLFNEIGDGLYAQVMNIRQKLAYGKQPEKWEREFCNRHKELIVLREKLTPEEEAELKEEQAFLDSISRLTFRKECCIILVYNIFRGGTIMFCNHCGRQNPDGARFCNFCGAPVSAQMMNVGQPRHQQRNAEIAELERMIRYFSQKSALYEEYDRLTPLVDRTLKGCKHVLLVLGIIAACVGLLTVPMVILKIMEDKNYVSIILPMMYLLPGIGMIVGYVFYANAFKKRAAKTFQRYDEVTAELFDYYQQYGTCLVGPEYTNPSNLITIMNTIKSGRADTTKDAINLLLEDTYRNNMQRIAAQAARSAAAAVPIPAMRYMI